jgi:tripeptide aminopeptidase
MKEVLKEYPQLTNNAMEAAEARGIEAVLKPIRGGTDGSNLTFRDCDA